MLTLNLNPDAETVTSLLREKVHKDMREFAERLEKQYLEEYKKVGVNPDAYKYFVRGLMSEAAAREFGLIVPTMC